MHVSALCVHDPKARSNFYQNARFSRRQSGYLCIGATDRKYQTCLNIPLRNATLFAYSKCTEEDAFPLNGVFCDNIICSSSH